MNENRLNYQTSGVDVEAGDRLVDWLQTSSKKQPHADKILSGIGGFAAAFRMNFPEINNPCLVSSTDGIGTKVKLAAHFKSYRTVGQDLVAMCVNDLICCGAKPLFFLDYYASGKLDLEAAKEFLTGVRESCHAVDCALIGGETAEMPGVYHGGDFDAAGFSVGLVDEKKMLGARLVEIGDQVIGVSSNGFHSNGFSLIRRAFETELDKFKDVLLKPTHLYVQLVLQLAERELLHAVAHITGGGMENIPRVLPAGTCLKLLDWPWPEEFLELQDRTQMSREEMLKTLNCGVGLALIVPKKSVNSVEELIVKNGFRAIHLGTVSAGPSSSKEAEVLY